MIFLRKKNKIHALLLCTNRKNDDYQRTQTGVRNANDINQNKTSVAAYLKLGVQI
jgi:hypothetical protein